MASTLELVNGFGSWLNRTSPGFSIYIFCPNILGKKGLLADYSYKTTSPIAQHMMIVSRITA